MARLTRHHIWHDRRSYQQDYELDLRRHHLMIPRIEPEYHNQGRDSLHANVEPPIKPTYKMTLGALAVLDGLHSDATHEDALDAMIDYFDHLRGGIAHAGRLIADNLDRQGEYIRPGLIAVKHRVIVA